MSEPTRTEIDQLSGPVVLEFGASWCPHCQVVQADVAEQLARFPAFRHIKIEDGKGRPLGRSFTVRLWPTFIFMHNGQIIALAVRPDESELQSGMEQLAAVS